MRIYLLVVAAALAGIIIYISVALLPMLSIATGYAAKYVCSCLFVAGLPLEEVKDTDLNFSVVGEVSLEIDQNQKLVKGDLFGLSTRAQHGRAPAGRHRGIGRAGSTAAFGR